MLSFLNSKSTSSNGLKFLTLNLAIISKHPYYNFTANDTYLPKLRIKYSQERALDLANLSPDFLDELPAEGIVHSKNGRDALAGQV